jgi:GH15 family glucan-1,4-alpha-glucosidase
MRRSLAPLAVAIALWPLVALAGTPRHSLQYLTTGNGFGFQVFDASQHKITQLLERPYRYLSAPSDPKAEGPIRRNLAFDVYFGLLAGGDKGWLKATDTDVAYVEESNVIRSTGQVGAIKTESYFFSPYGYDGNAMVMLLKVTNTGGSPVNIDGAALFNFHMGTGSGDNPGSNGEAVSFDAGNGVGVETGPGGGAMIYVGIGGVDKASCSGNAYNEINGGSSISPMPSCNGNDLPEVFQKSMGSVAGGASAWWGAAVLYEAGGSGAKDAAVARWNTFLNSRSAEQLMQGVLDEWKSWRKAIPTDVTKSAQETAIWRQSEAVLRMGQIREPWSESPKLKNNGMILASLPPGGWHTGWVRDAQYALVALARLGHCAEAKAALDFFLNAEAGPTNSAVSGGYKSFLKNVDYRISVVRYFGNGVEEADYSGQQTPNVEIDGWGMYLWSVRTYLDSCDPTGTWLSGKTKYNETIYDVINQKVAKALESNLDATGGNFIVGQDTSIWEVHWGSAQHFFYTSATAARGFCDMATIAQRAGKETDLAHYKELAGKVVGGIKATMVDKGNVIAGTVEKLQQGSLYHDGATVEAITWDLGLGDTINNATMTSNNVLHTGLGGYKRIEGSTESYDTNEWILLDLRMSDAWRRIKQPNQANPILDWVTGQAALNYNLIPELYDVNKNGDYTGSIPMVGYGAGAYVLTLLARAGIMAPTECGAKPPVLTEQGIPRIDYGPPSETSVQPTADSGSSLPPDEPSGFACLCKLDRRPSGWTVAPVLAIGLLALLGWRVRRKR